MSFFVETKRFGINQTKEQAFNTDTILLANFINIPKVCKNILDVGTGSGVLMIDMAFRTSANIHGVEIQENRYLQAVSNIELNGLSDRLTVNNTDFKSYHPNINYDLIISNPPFFKVNDGKRLSENKEDMIARHEVELTLNDLVKNVSRLLKFRGHFYMIHRPDRLDEIISSFDEYNLSIKEIRFVHPNINKDANHILIHAIKNGGKGLKVLKPLILYKDIHIFTDEMEKIIGDF